MAGWNPCPNLDGCNTVNFSDFAVLADEWQLSGADLAGDIDESGKVDANDLGVLCDYWLEECY